LVVPAPNLERAAREFARELKELLNRTVCSGVHIPSLLGPDGRAVVGTRLDKVRLDTEPVRLMTPNPQARCWLNLVCRLFFDPRGFLTVHDSTFAISTGRDGEHELFHYDYERDKTAYTEAHIQVNAKSEPLEQLMSAIGKPDRGLHKLHLPVGGRRFRPALEDVLEFLIDEGIVTPATGWKGFLDRGREEFRTKQLKAAIARNHEAAAEALRDCNYEVRRLDDPPDEGGRVLDLIRRRPKKRRG
jgi:hypothetical protein